MLNFVFLSSFTFESFHYFIFFGDQHLLQHNSSLFCRFQRNLFDNLPAWMSMLYPLHPSLMILSHCSQSKKVFRYFISVHIAYRAIVIIYQIGMHIQKLISTSSIYFAFCFSIVTHEMSLHVYWKIRLIAKSIKLKLVEYAREQKENVALCNVSRKHKTLIWVVWVK